MALSTNLVSYWKFDESSGNATDQLGTNNLNNNGTITYSAGKINNGANLDVNKYFTAGVTTYDVTQPFSFAFWIKGTGTNLAGLFFRGNWQETSQVGIEHNGGSGIRFVMRNGGDQSVNSNTAVNDGNYHLGVVTKSGTGSTGEIKIYVDNVLKDTQTLTNLSNISDPLVIGKLGDSTNTAYAFTGQVDESGLWSRTLDTTDISELWNGGAGNAYPFLSAPTVTTQAATDVAKTSFTGNGNITATGGANATRRGFCYLVGASGDPTIADSIEYEDGDFGTGAFTKSIS